jgi:phosphoserine phosphatase
MNDIQDHDQPLSLWNQTPVTQAILDYISGVCAVGSPEFIPPAERIATFDNDGTLWCEKPAYIQLFFAIHRLKELAKADASLLEQPGYRAAANGDLAYFDSLYPGNLTELRALLFDTHAGMSQAEFEAQAAIFLSQQAHPRYGVPFKRLVYQPMVQLMRYLEAHEFKVFIATAGGMSFVRTVSEEIYRISRERVIGSNTSFESRMTDQGPVLYRRPGLVDPIGDGAGKPVNIELHIGRKPILAAGNADGDIHMLLYSETNPYKSLQLLVHHDDAEREYTYDGGAEKALELAAEHDWLVISMKRDFIKVFHL